MDFLLAMGADILVICRSPCYTSLHTWTGKSPRTQDCTAKLTRGNVNSGNIGNARLAGLEKDLNMKGEQYNIALTIFFVSYIVFEVPAKMALKYLSPRTWSKFLSSPVTIQIG